MRAVDLNMVITKSLDVEAMQQNQQNVVAAQQQMQADEANRTALREMDQVWQSIDPLERDGGAARPRADEVRDRVTDLILSLNRD